MESSLEDLVLLAKSTFKHALNSVMPERLLNDIIEIKNDKELIIHNKFSDGNDVHYNLDGIKNILIVGAGKANQQLCIGMFDILKSSEKCKSMNIKGYVNYPKNQEKFTCPSDYNITFMEATHPLPDQSTYDSTKTQLSAIDEAEDETLLICLFSGGGSSLFELPYQSNDSEDNISLSDLQKTNEVLLMSGATIQEINTIRKHLSQVKGGNLAKYALRNPKIKNILGLYLSDVVGNDISSVASGPTCPDLTTFEDCMNISNKYSIFDKFPKSVQDRIQHGMKNISLETPKPGDPLFTKVSNILIGSSDTSALAAKEYLQQNGINNVNIFSNNLEGEANEFGSKLIGLIDDFSKQYHNSNNYKAAFIGTGEFTVTIKGNGVGGRNQEMLLSFLVQLCKESSMDSFALKDLNFVVLSCAFDGIEGNSNVTGALVNSSSIDRLKKIVDGDLEKYLISKLNNNDSFTVLNLLNDTISTSGYTGTNVNDMTLIIVAKK